MEIPSGVLGRNPGRGSRSPQKLKQFADIADRILLQKRQKFEHFAQFASSFLTSMFHCWGLNDDIL